MSVAVPPTVGLAEGARVKPWAALLLVAPLALLTARQAPYLTGALGFTLFAIPHNLTELTFFFAGRGAVGSALPRAPRWALAGLLLLMTPAFLYLVPGLITPQQKMALFGWHMGALVMWLGAMLLAAPLPVLARASGLALMAAAPLAAKAPLVTSVLVANLHHITALVMAWLILRARPQAEQRAAKPLFLALLVFTIGGSSWLLLAPGSAPGPEVIPGAADALGGSIYLPDMSMETLDRFMSVYSFQLWLHYAVWVMLVPSLGLLPRAVTRPLVVIVALAVAACASMLFWQDFAATRTVYLALAGLHSYGEFPVMLFYRRGQPC